MKTGLRILSLNDELGIKISNDKDARHSVSMSNPFPLHHIASSAVELEDATAGASLFHLRKGPHPTLDSPSEALPDPLWKDIDKSATILVYVDEQLLP